MSWICLPTTTSRWLGIEFMFTNMFVIFMFITSFDHFYWFPYTVHVSTLSDEIIPNFYVIPQGHLKDFKDFPPSKIDCYLARHQGWQIILNLKCFHTMIEPVIIYFHWQHLISGWVFKKNNTSHSAEKLAALRKWRCVMLNCPSRLWLNCAI